MSNVLSIDEVLKDFKSNTNRKQPTKKDIVPPVEDNRADRDLEEVMTIESEPEKTKAYLEEVDRQALSDYESNDN